MPSSHDPHCTAAIASNAPRHAIRHQHIVQIDRSDSMLPARPVRPHLAPVHTAAPPAAVISAIACKPVDCIGFESLQADPREPIRFGVFLERLNRAYAYEKPRRGLRLAERMMSHVEIGRRLDVLA